MSEKQNKNEPGEFHKAAGKVGMDEAARDREHNQERRARSMLASLVSRAKAVKGYATELEAEAADLLADVKEGRRSPTQLAVDILGEAFEEHGDVQDSLGLVRRAATHMAYSRDAKGMANRAISLASTCDGVIDGLVDYKRRYQAMAARLAQGGYSEGVEKRVKEILTEISCGRGVAPDMDNEEDMCECEVLLGITDIEKADELTEIAEARARMLLGIKEEA